MPIKKSELYSSLWASCDSLRGGMDASQYKDYVLVLLFIKYISDKYAGQPYAPITVPEGASFKDMVALKGKPDIGDQINKKIIEKLAKSNNLSDMPDFNDATKLGSGKEMVDRLTDLIAIFENKSLDFSKNRAEGDDILGDAYEYLMRHFATESGKSKGQFYTPAEVSRIIDQILGIRTAKTSASTTVYDPTCGSGSLLLKVADEATSKLTLYGQETDSATSGLARMNMILHNNPEALIFQGNTLTDHKFKDGEALKTFDYVVANPPFSDKRWSTGLDPLHDPFDRFQHFGVPPGKHGWHSVPGGIKPTFLAQNGHTLVNPQLPDDDFAEAVSIAQAEFDQHQPQVVIGSSRGSAVAINIKSGDAKLVLLCPAWKNWGTVRTVKPGTIILHSRHDEVIPFADSQELAKYSGAALIEVGTDHRLGEPEPLMAMLRACA